ncbi:hypothetical protein CTZ28_36665 [Streptomyces shenzhenensis]|uniref:Uncharacterized protein n=1 Tax=Streptomyces shenzhenensis TaxID=943815 RepID=A0A3M0HX07_9ACTN|nr:hypothetical protein CTZ28_36665 [Streptomyces shenzhenensis]
MLQRATAARIFTGGRHREHREGRATAAARPCAGCGQDPQLGKRIALIGYARAVVDGDWAHVSGTTGFDYRTLADRRTGWVRSPAPV